MITKRRLRRFISGELNHVYQRTLQGYNIFYDREDYLLYYTIFSVLARYYELIVLGLCLMEDHIHSLVQTIDRDILSRFMDHCTSVFVKEYNSSIGRKGGLFRKRFGSAPKIGNKKIRTAISYLFNNPVEKHLCTSAEDYRWNFLAYAISDHPFSKMIPPRKMSRALKRAMSVVDSARESDNYLKINFLRRVFSKISDDEAEYLTDYIIVRYSPFDYERLLGYYGSFQALLLAVNSNTGSEYDIKEEYNHFSDVEYYKMKKLLTAKGIIPIRGATMLSENDKWDLLKYLQLNTSADLRQISKFLHIHILS